MHQQIAALHQLHPHFPSQEHVLVEGRVVHPGREQNDARVADPRRRKLGQRLPEELPVVLDSPHRVAAEEVPQAGLDRSPVGEHVGDAGWHPQVVLQHHEPVVGAHQVGAAYRDVGSVRYLDVAHFNAVLGTATNEVHGHHAVTEDSSRAVDVGEKQVQRFQALAQPPDRDTPIRARSGFGAENRWE